MPPLSYVFWAAFAGILVLGVWSGYSWPTGRRYVWPGYLFVLICLFCLGYKVFS